MKKASNFYYWLLQHLGDDDDDYDVDCYREIKFCSVLEKLYKWRNELSFNLIKTENSFP